MKAFFIWTTF